MTPLQIAGQAVSILAMACNILSYQQKKQSRLVILQLSGGLLFATSFFMLGAIMGGILNLLATIRAVIFLFPDKTKASHPAWLVGSVACFFIFYALTFTVFGVEPKPVSFAIEILPVIGMTALSVGFMLGDSRSMRRVGLISSPVWLIYNIYYISIGAIICEAISICSIFIGMLRHDRESSKPKEDAEQTEKSA